VCALDKITGTKREMSVAEPPVGRFATRRKSVFAETYNPEEDDEEEGVRVSSPLCNLVVQISNFSIFIRLSTPSQMNRGSVLPIVLKIFYSLEL